MVLAFAASEHLRKHWEYLTPDSSRPLFCEYPETLQSRLIAIMLDKHL
jgi:hypothetical protein